VALKHYTVMRNHHRGHKATSQRGFSLVEVMMALLVMGIGLVGGIMVIAVSTVNNGNSKLHTAAATLARSTMEKILAIPQGLPGNTQTSMTDCAGNNFVVETAPTAPQSGTPLIQSGAFNGSVDFSAAPVPNYSMQYVACSNTGPGMVYDIRWSVIAGPTPATQLVTVSAKPGIGNQATPAAKLTLPVTFHQLRGND
jgi:prepilin-type N-terminal cleavage/methylation domain-containing protein